MYLVVMEQMVEYLSLIRSQNMIYSVVVSLQLEYVHVCIPSSNQHGVRIEQVACRAEMVSSDVS